MFRRVSRMNRKTIHRNTRCVHQKRVGVAVDDTMGIMKQRICFRVNPPVDLGTAADHVWESDDIFVGVMSAPE